MPAPKRHPLVRADLQSAYDWYEDELPGLGSEFREEFYRACRKLRQGVLRYAVQGSSRRLSSESVRQEICKKLPGEKS